MKALRIITFLSFVSIILIISVAVETSAANYPLQIIQPQQGLNTNNRYYKAYPGLEYKVPIVVYGGVLPFQYEFITAISGMTMDEDGRITWPNPTQSGSPYSVSVRVTDNEGIITTVSWTITVTTQGFVFLDSVNGSPGGTGTINSPLDSFETLYGGTTENFDTTWQNYFVYFRGGTYIPGGYLRRTCPGDAHCSYNWPDEKPLIWLEYPGETVIVDHDQSGGMGAYFHVYDPPNNMFVHGIRFQDMKNFVWRFPGETLNAVIFENEFFDLGPGEEGMNTSFIMTGGTQQASRETFLAIIDNTFDTTDYGAFVRLYQTNKAVIARNIMQNGSAQGEGIAIKAYNRFLDVRENRIYNSFRQSIGGNWNACSELEIRNNLIMTTNSDCPGPGGNEYYSGMRINQHSTAGRSYIHHNTLSGCVGITEVLSGNGPFYLYNNIVINTEFGRGINNDDDGLPSHIALHYGNRIAGTTIVNNNLGRLPGSGTIDVNGDLTPAYSSYLGTHGHQASGGSTPPPPPLVTRPNPPPSSGLTIQSSP